MYSLAPLPLHLTPSLHTHTHFVLARKTRLHNYVWQFARVSKDLHHTTVFRAINWIFFSTFRQRAGSRGGVAGVSVWDGPCQQLSANLNNKLMHAHKYEMEIEMKIKVKMKGKVEMAMFALRFTFLNTLWMSSDLLVLLVALPHPPPYLCILITSSRWETFSINIVFNDVI